MRVYCPIEICEHNNRSGREYWQSGVCEKDTIELELFDWEDSDLSSVIGLTCEDLKRK